MTRKEFQELLTKVTDQEWLKTAEWELTNPNTGYYEKLIGIDRMHGFFYSQSKGWERLEGNIPSEIRNIANQVGSILSGLEGFVNQYKNQNGSYLNSIFEPLKRRYPTPFLPYNSPEIKYVLELYNNNATRPYYSGALSFFKWKLGEQLNLNDRNFLIGTFLAYDFTLDKDDSRVKRRKVERLAVKEVQKELQQNLESIHALSVANLKDVKEKHQEFCTGLEAQQKSIKESFDEWFKKSQADNKIFDKDCKDKITTLEQTYREKLKLEEPAKYWENRAKKLKCQAKCLLGLLIFITGIVAFTLIKLLITVPEEMLVSIFDGKIVKAIRWTIIYATLITFMAYVIRAISKLMFSSFHLARDSEERNALTYFYLALLSDKKVDEKDRQLIMQSLFSRAETGLLKDDSSPTMPNEILTTIMQNTGK